jgi:curli biogenesis system outer membrane secretion channel CsgG
VVDRTLREDIIAEQELSLSGISDETVDVGGIAGAKAILTGAVLQFSSETSRPISTTRNAFRKYFKEVLDDEGKTKKVAAFAPARYTLHNQRRTVQLKFEIKLVSTETGAVLMSQVEQVQVEDAIEFAVSQVQAGSLYPARSNGAVDRNGQRRMNQLLRAPRELRPASSMRTQLVAQAIARGQKDIEGFLSQHIQ